MPRSTSPSGEDPSLSSRTPGVVPESCGTPRVSTRSTFRLGRTFGVAVGVLALGLLIWAKLQLVAGVPRTAVAVPEKPAQTANGVDTRNR